MKPVLPRVLAPDALRGYAAGPLREDLLAALVVSVLLVPQSIAYALLAGLPAQAGLYASLLPLIAYAALGSSPLLGIGPVAVLALMISQAISDLPAGFTPQAAGLVLAAEIGIVLALAALARFDALAALLSLPVLAGFEAGASISIAMSQLPVLLGSSAHGSSVIDLSTSWRTAETLWTPMAALYGLAALLALYLVRNHLARALTRVMPRSRASMLAKLAPLAVLVAAGLAASWAPARSVPLVGELPQLSAQFTVPVLDPALWKHLLPSALLIALVGFVMSLVVAESLARRHGGRIVPRREMAALAAANVTAALSGGMPVAASFSRSVLNADAGSRTRMTGVYTAIVIALVLWLGGSLLSALPRPALAATIVLAVLAGLQVAPFRDAWRYARSEWALMVGVAALTLFQGVAWALAIGVAVSIALLLQRTACPHVALIGRVGETEHFRNVGRYETVLTPGVMGLRIDESLLFINARMLGDVVAQQLAHYEALHPGTRRVVLQMSPVNQIDFSGLEALRALHDGLAARGVRLDLSEVKGPVVDRLRAGGWASWFQGRLFLSHHQAMHGDGGSGA